MKILPKLFFVSLLFLCFSCSENINLEKIDSGFMIPAPSQTSDMKLLARSSTEDSLLLTVNLLNADDNSVIDNFSTSCAPEELIPVQLEAEKGDKVCVEIIFSDINIPDLIWAYGKSESVVLSEKETDISVELEYYDLAFYLTQNPLKLSAVDKFSNEITQKSDSGDFVVKSNDVLTAQILGLDIFGEMDATAEPYSISWTLNGVELGTVENDENFGEEIFIPVTTDSITLDIFKTEGILSQNNVLQAVIDITGVGKFNASFIFDVELNLF